MLNHYLTMFPTKRIQIINSFITIFCTSFGLKYVYLLTLDSSFCLPYSRVIWLGDLNYRIYLPMATTRSLVKDKEWSILLENDQVMEMRIQFKIIKNKLLSHHNILIVQFDKAESGDEQRPYF